MRTLTVTRHKQEDKHIFIISFPLFFFYLRNLMEVNVSRHKNISGSTYVHIVTTIFSFSKNIFLTCLCVSASRNINHLNIFRLKGFLHFFVHFLFFHFFSFCAVPTDSKHVILDKIQQVIEKIHKFLGPHTPLHTE